MAILIHDCVYKDTLSSLSLKYLELFFVHLVCRDQKYADCKNSFLESLKVFEIILFLAIQTNRFANDASSNSHPTHRNG